MHLGDFDAAAVIYGKFSTYRPSTGATFALGGSAALSVYKDNSTTQSTTGVTLTVDFDAVTGLNHFAIDTSADGTFYAAGSFFDIVITTGTVDSVSVTGSVVGSFTLRKTASIKPTTAGRTLDVTATGAAGVDWGNVENPTTALNLSGTNIDVDQVVASVSGAVGSVTGAVGSVTGAVGSVTGNVGGNVVGSVASVTARVTANTDQLAGQTVTAGAGVTFPASVASPTNITAGVITTVTNLTNAPTVGDLTAAMKASVNTEADTALTDYDGPTNAELATALGTADDAVLAQIALVKTKTDFLPSATAGAAGGVFIAGTNAATTITTGLTTTFTGNLTGSVGSVTGAVGSVTGNVGGNVVGSVASVTADVGITQGAADKAWNTATRELTAGTNIVLAKGTGITGFNDLSAAQVNAEADTALADVGVTTTVTGRIDVAISTRLATAGYTAPDNASIATILGVTNKLDPMLEDDGDSPTGGYRYTAEALELAPTGGSAPTAAQVADAVWDEARAGHVAGGSFGEGMASVQGNVTGSTASVTGAVGSVTGNVGGNVVGSVASVTADVGITQAGADKAWGTAARVLTAGTNIVLAKGVGVTGFNDLSAAQVNAEADTALADVGVTGTVTGRIDVAVSTRASQASVDTLDNLVDNEVGEIKAVTDKLAGMIELGVGSPTYYRYNTPALELAPTGGSAPSAAVIADAVWDELLAGHAIGGSAGAALSAAGTAGDPWSTALPGAYGAGTAGKIVGDNINATISSRAIPGDAMDLVTDAVDANAVAASGVTEIQANLATSASIVTLQADSDDIQTRLPAALVGGRMDASVGAMAANTLTASALATDAVNEIVDQTWDEAIAGHLAAGSTGLALNDATAAGNPWNSVLEGTFTAGDLLRIQAGVAVGKTTIVAPGNGTAHVEFRDASDLSLIVAADMTGSERTAVALTP